jgi:cysteinyl-tRNA synthetase
VKNLPIEDRTMTLKLYDTAERKIRDFVPIDPRNVRMYVCGPTVYDDAHIGNARPAVVFDVLFRILRSLYGADAVDYARNITDVDDKIIDRALALHPSGNLMKSIVHLTSDTTAAYRRAVHELGCIPPTFEPEATGHIAHMISMVETLVEKGHAYVAGDHVFFDTTSFPEGHRRLSPQSPEDLRPGARVVVDNLKRSPADFVLWKPAADGEPGWDSPYPIKGKGRPGWHIECSAMSLEHLGAEFDIHGGGADLLFPHHENENSQSCCANGTPRMANYWVHNDFVMVDDRKMSKTDGNFVTIRQLLETEEYGGRRWDGRIVRLALLTTHYRNPMSITVAKLQEAEAMLDATYRRLDGPLGNGEGGMIHESLLDDIDTPTAIRWIRARIDDGHASDPDVAATAEALGILRSSPASWFRRGAEGIDPEDVDRAIAARADKLAQGDWVAADQIRSDLHDKGVVLQDRKVDGIRVTTWESKAP